MGSFAYLGFDGTYIYLNFASFNAAVNGSCGLQTHWDCETITKVGTLGLAGYPSLAYIGNLPVIAYRDTAGRLNYAARVGSGIGNCPLSNQWQCNEIDRNSLVAGGISFLYTTTRSAAAYYDSVTHYMIVANDTSGSCDWTCTYIEDVGAQTTDTHGIAIAIRNGKYLVAYTYRKSPSNTILKVAYPDANGNCGPYIGGVHSWRCEVLDDGGGTQNVGKFISMAVSASNVVYIAYSNDTNQTLKLAYLDNNFFIPLVKR